MPGLSRSLRLAITILAAVLLIAAPVPPAAADPTYKQVPLTRDMVTRMLAAFPELKALGQKYEKQAPPPQKRDKGPVGALSGYLQHHAARAEMDAILSKHGFSGFPAWLDVARSVALAYGFVKSGKTPEQLGGQAEQALAAIRDNQQLTKDQKAQMEALVRRQLGALKQYEPLPQNLKLAQDMQSEIAAVMDSD